MIPPEKDKSPCPSLSGTYTAYSVEYQQRGSTVWHSGHRQSERREYGIPSDQLFSGINKTLHLLSYEQAMAIAWVLKAEHAADFRCHGYKVRVVPYHVSFECKAFIMEDEIEAIEVVRKSKEKEPPQ